MILSKNRITRGLISLHICCSQTLKTGFLTSKPIWQSTSHVLQTLNIFLGDIYFYGYFPIIEFELLIIQNKTSTSEDLQFYEICLYVLDLGGQWLSGRVLDLRPTVQASLCRGP